MSMTVGELKEYLENFDDEAEVRIMSQPSWPFEYSIDSVKSREDFEDIENSEDEPQRKEKNISDVFIIEGSQLCYGNKDAFY
jgi:hypothetical protein